MNSLPIHNKITTVVVIFSDIKKTNHNIICLIYIIVWYLCCGSQDIFEKLYQSLFRPFDVKSLCWIA